MKTFSPQKYDHAHSDASLQQGEAKTVTSPIYNKGVSNSAELYEQVEYVVKQIELQQKDIVPDYKDWVKVGFALNDAFGDAGLGFFLRLSNPHRGCKQSDARKQYAKCQKSGGQGVTIATFFQYAKDAGLSITPPKTILDSTKPMPTIPHEATQEVQNKENGSLDFWISGSEKSDVVAEQEALTSKQATADVSSPVVIESHTTESSPAAQEIQKSRNPEIQSGVIGSKWIVDEENLPHFPQSVYDALPPFLNEVIRNCDSADDRDMLLMGSLACLSSTLHNVCGKYKGDYWYPMLYFFVMAEAGMGKGALTCSRQLVAPINKQLRDISEQQIHEYKQDMRMAKKEGNAMPDDEPKRRTLFIPTNSSAAAFVEQLDNNQGIGLLFDTECATLTSVLNTDFGDYTSLLCKAYHHEPIELSRRKDNEFRDIERPMVAICISGTPEQLHVLTPDTENGLFSRILYYHVPFEESFCNPFDDDNTNVYDSLRNRFYQLGLKYQRMREAFFRGGEYRVVIPQHLSHEFYAYFRSLNHDTVEDISHAMQGIIRRLAFATFRIMMILTAIRFMDETPNPSAIAQKDKPTLLTCNDADFHTAMSIADTLIYHIAYCYAHLPKTKAATGAGGKILSKKDKMNILYDALPDTFDKPQYAAESVKLGYSTSTTSKWINDYITAGQLERNGQNSYRKISPNTPAAS